MASSGHVRVLLRGQAGGRGLGSSGDGDALEDDMNVNVLTLDNVIPPHQPQPDQTRPKAEPEDGDAALRQTLTTVGIIVFMSMATLLVMYCLFARSGYGRWTKQRGSFKWVAAPVEPGEKPCLAVRVWLADGAPVALPPGVMQQLQDQMGDAYPYRPKAEPIPSPPEVSPPMLPKIKISDCPTPPESPSKVCMGIGIPAPPESSPPTMPQISRNHRGGTSEGAQAGAHGERRPTSASSGGAIASACRGERRPASASSGGAVASACRGRAVQGERRPASAGAVASACRGRAVQGERRPASAGAVASACRGRAVQGERRPSSASSCEAVPSPCRGRATQSASLGEETPQHMTRCHSAPHRRNVEQLPQDASLQPPLRRPGAWSPAAVEARAHASKLAILDDIALRRNSRPQRRSESQSQPILDEKALRRNSRNLQRSVSLS